MSKYLLPAAFLLGCQTAPPVESSEQTQQASDPLWHGGTIDRPSLEFAGNEIILRVPGFYLAKKIIAGAEYSVITVPGHSALDQVGMPALPKVRVNVPANGSPSLQVVDSTYTDITIAAPVPSRGILTRDVDESKVPYSFDAFYQGSSGYPADAAAIGPRFMLREIAGAAIEFHPFTYFPAEHRLRVYHQLRVRLSGVHETILAQHSSEFDGVYASAFGERISVEGDIVEPGRQLIITADAYAPALAPLREWKTKRGLRTEIKKLSEIGTTADAIKAYIAAQYAAPGSLTYVLLVGDIGDMPTLKGGFEGADCDSCYGMVAGDDYYPDLFVSRLSVQSLAQAQLQVAKIVGYERTPDTAGAWYSRAISIASDQGSPTDGERAEVLRTSLEPYGYTVAKNYDPSATAQHLVADIEAGASLVNYIGHGSGTSWGTTNFDTSNASALNNGSKLPFVIDVSCVNGAFADNDTSLAEAMLRAPNGGAVGMYSASTNASWVPPTDMQLYAVRELLVTEKKHSLGSLYYGGAANVLQLYSDGEGQKLVEQYVIFGDASLVVRTKAPHALTVQHPASISGEFDVRVTLPDGSPAIGATVVVSNADVLAVSATESDGNAHVAYAGGAGAVNLTVTHFNGVPYEATLH